MLKKNFKNMSGDFLKKYNKKALEIALFCFTLKSRLFLIKNTMFHKTLLIKKYLPYFLYVGRYINFV
jgi:hypothetical protein